MGDLEQKLLNEHIVLMAVAAWFIMWVVQRVFPIININTWAKRLKPLYPVFLCQGFVWVPGAVEDGTGLGGRILIAFWCGFLASFGYQIAKRLLEPRGVDLPDDPNQMLNGIVRSEEAKPEPEISDSSSEPSDLTPAETPSSKSATPPPRPVEPEKED